MIECMAGKSAAVHGLVHDATPFRFSEENTGIDYHGKLLEEGKDASRTPFSSIFSFKMTFYLIFGFSWLQLLWNGKAVQWYRRQRNGG